MRKLKLGLVLRVATLFALITACAVIIGIFWIASGINSVVYLERPGPGVMAALDDDSCRVLIIHEMGQAASPDQQYEKAIEQGKLVHVNNGTVIQGINQMFLKNGKFIPTYSLNGNEIKEHQIGFVNWVMPKEGPYKGRTLCVNGDAIRAKGPPL